VHKTKDARRGGEGETIEKGGMTVKSLMWYFQRHALFLFVVLFVCSCGGEGKIPQSVRLSECFYSYNYVIDWAALGDPNNNPILHAYLEGASEEKLGSLRITDIDERIKRLERGRIIKRFDDSYMPAHPVIAGGKRRELNSVIRQAAAKMLPVTRDTVRKIRPYFKGHEEMLYHVVWSGIMDGGLAWQTLEEQLERQAGKADIDLRMAWWIYPEHSHHAGTNTYGSAQGAWIITGLKGFPEPHIIREAIQSAENNLIHSGLAGTAVGKENVNESLRRYGLIDGKGHSRLFILEKGDPVVPVASKLSVEFARNAIKHLDLEGISRILATTPEQSLVISYHELCYELLKELTSTGALALPKAADAGEKGVRRLVSFYMLNPP